jgi:hypothetical protein
MVNGIVLSSHQLVRVSTPERQRILTEDEAVMGRGKGNGLTKTLEEFQYWQ